MPELAQALGVSVIMVADMIGQLVRAGYLEEIEERLDSSCSNHCCTSTCGVQHGCLLGIGNRIWLLTEKGKTRASTLHK